MQPFPGLPPGRDHRAAQLDPRGLHRSDVRHDEALPAPAPARGPAPAAVGQRGARPRAARRPGDRGAGDPGEHPDRPVRRGGGLPRLLQAALRADDRDLPAHRRGRRRGCQPSMPNWPTWRAGTVPIRARWSGGTCCSPPVGRAERTETHCTRRRSPALDDPGAGLRRSLGWRWRESNPRPPAIRQGFYGRSARCLYSAPPVMRTSRCDRPSCCEMSRRAPQPGPTVILLATPASGPEALPG